MNNLMRIKSFTVSIAVKSIKIRAQLFLMKHKNENKKLDKNSMSISATESPLVMQSTRKMSIMMKKILMGLS